jgi:hypothetical protein
VCQRTTTNIREINITSKAPRKYQMEMRFKAAVSSAPLSSRTKMTNSATAKRLPANRVIV